MHKNENSQVEKADSKDYAIERMKDFMERLIKENNLSVDEVQYSPFKTKQYFNVYTLFDGSQSGEFQIGNQEGIRSFRFKYQGGCFWFSPQAENECKLEPIYLGSTLSEAIIASKPLLNGMPRRKGSKILSSLKEVATGLQASLSKLFGASPQDLIFKRVDQSQNTEAIKLADWRAESEYKSSTSTKEKLEKFAAHILDAGVTPLDGSINIASSAYGHELTFKVIGARGLKENYRFVTYQGKIAWKYKTGMPVILSGVPGIAWDRAKPIFEHHLKEVLAG